MKDIKSVFSVNLRNKLAAKNKTQAQPLKTKIFASNWKELYMELDEDHRRSFWRNIIKKIIVDVEISTFDIIY